MIACLEKEEEEEMEALLNHIEPATLPAKDPLTTIFVIDYLLLLEQGGHIQTWLFKLTCHTKLHN
jgi:hypothetical protein